MRMWIVRGLLAVTHLVALVNAAPSGFPASGNGLWYTTPGTVWSRELLPIGNGYLAAMTPGGTALEATQLNIETLWAGGPFADPLYNGGNKQPSEQAATAQAMQSIRQTIFQSPTGDIDGKLLSFNLVERFTNIETIDVEALATDPGQYGSYAGAGYLITNLNATGTISNYARWLDLDQGLARTSWTQSGSSILRTSFCSHPTKSCVQQITSSPHPLPQLTHTFSSLLEPGLPAPNITCISSNTLQVRGFVSESPPGMLYELLFTASATHPSSSGASVQCVQFPVPFGAPPNATLQIPAGASDASISWVGGTEFDPDAGDAAHNFTFKGADPHDALLAQSTANTKLTYAATLAGHVADVKATLHTPFTLDLGQVPQLDVSTDVLKTQYTIDGTGATNPYLEWVLFNYGRYMLMSSARGVLPTNLQGKWANGISNAWSADYHSNINIQMNYWSAETTNLDVTASLFDYFEKNWAPRGAYTAQVLYNISRGWVVHNEMNIFGHSGMKGGGNTAEWANYPESAVWMMLHVWDHFDFTNDVTWWKAQGWPLIKGVASFHLDKLIPDLHFNDSTLVVNPCNSPEQVPITLGCAHAQQLIWQLFNAVEKGFSASGDTDTAFLQEVQATRAKMDKGLRIGSWGQLQEWKVEKDSPTDTHRHLSHLVGLYPGYAVSSYDETTQGGLLVNSTKKTYTKAQILDAATVSLIHRGNGTGPDADSGWEKAWRAAAWAQLGNATTFYHELSFAISENFGPSLFSLYNPFDPNPIFQIDANLGYPAAVMNALIQAPDVHSLSTPLTVTLLPALPPQWSTGSIQGARVRGGITVNLQWSGGKPTKASFKVDAAVVPRQVNIVYAGKVLSSFKTSGGVEKSVTHF